MNHKSIFPDRLWRAPSSLLGAQFLIARFSETYTFLAEVGDDEAVQWQIKPEGAGDYTTLFDHTGGGSASATFALTAGARYDVRVEYREVTVLFLHDAFGRLGFNSSPTKTLIQTGYYQALQ